MDLDVYEHVNNVIYVNYAEEADRAGFFYPRVGSRKLAEADLAMVTRRMHIQYLSIASWGETLEHFHTSRFRKMEQAAHVMLA